MWTFYGRSIHLSKVETPNPSNYHSCPYVVVIPRLWIRVALVIFDPYPIPCANFCLRVWTLKQTQKVWPEKVTWPGLPSLFFPSRAEDLGSVSLPFHLSCSSGGVAMVLHSSSMFSGWSFMGLSFITLLCTTPRLQFWDFEMTNLVIHNRQSHKVILNTNNVHEVGSVHNRSSCPRCGPGSNILFWLWIWSLDQRRILYRLSLMPLR